MMKFGITLKAFHLLPLFLWLHVGNGAFPFQDIKLTFEERVDDLVNRLSLDELVEQLAKGGLSPGAGPAPAIPRLGVPPHSWDTECGRGVANSGPATSFPQPIGTAASFNRNVVHTIAVATAKELRAKYDNYTAHQQWGTNMGITCLSPVVNIMRHPFWGRNQETYGEDPYLTGEMGATFVRGLQGNHSRYIRAGGGCKHFNVHGGPDNYPVSRYDFDAKVSERDWRTTYLPAFYDCIVKGKSVSTMCSYNSINGVPACANKKLLTDILRNEWNFTGYVIADQDAMENIVERFHWVPTMEEAAAKSLIAGTNLGLSTQNPKSVFTYLPEALNQSLVTRQQIRDAAKPLFHVRMRLGEFDPPEMNPFTSYNVSLIQSQEHQEISLNAAMQSFVLLRNKNNVLPLKEKRYKAITVVGPMADNGRQLFGVYGAPYDAHFVKTPLASLREMADNVYYADGCSRSLRCKRYKADDVINAVQQSDTQLIIVCLGTGIATETEGLDRQDLALPGKQQKLLDDVIVYSGNVPIIVLLFTGSPVLLDPAMSVDAIIECFFPAQTTGEAVRRILWNEGPGSNPAGRLPFTWQASMSQVPSMEDYSMVDRTYRYWERDTPSFPFGYGLSYSQFEYSNLKILFNDHPKIGEDVRFEVEVTNKGPYDGDEVTQAYISWVNPPETMPKLQLIAFERHTILKNDSLVYSATVTASQMAVYLDQFGFQQVRGDIMLYVGGQQPNQTVNVGSNVLQTKITVT